MSAVRQRATVSGDQRIVEAIQLLEDVERVEFKLTVRDTEHKSVVEALELDLIEAADPEAVSAEAATVL